MQRDDLDAPYVLDSGPSDAVALPDGSMPMPRQEGGEAVLPRARKDFLAMSRQQELKGIGKYGRSLHTQNGRDPLDDLAEELVDAFHYLTQARMERDARDPAITLAREILEHVNDWATMDPEGKRFPWIAARTAEALEAERWSADRNCLQWAEKLDAAEREIALMRPVVVAACAWRDMTTGVFTGHRRAVIEAGGNFANIVADYQEAARREGGGGE